MQVSHDAVSWIHRIGLSISLLAGVAVVPASAAAIGLSDAAGAWINPAGTPDVQIFNVAGQGLDEAKWGNANGYSGYQFVPVSDTMLTTESPFLLGTFTHVNEVISVDAITSIDYLLSFNLVDSLPMPLEFLLHFDHNETYNDPATCLALGVEFCGDDVVTTTLPGQISFLTGGTDTYYLHLLGFSQDGGLTFSSRYFSPENGSNTAMLYGMVSSDPAPIPNPEPATIALFGTGLLAAIAARRRARRTSQPTK
jgi:hypothetical protein